MAKKYVSGENLVYALNLFERRIKEMINNITHIEQAATEDVERLFPKDGDIEEEIEIEK
jgi:hypothetical protein